MSSEYQGRRLYNATLLCGGVKNIGLEEALIWQIQPNLESCYSVSNSRCPLLYWNSTRVNSGGERYLQGLDGGSFSL